MERKFLNTQNLQRFFTEVDTLTDWALVGRDPSPIGGKNMSKFFDECSRIRSLIDEAECARHQLQERNTDPTWAVSLHLHYMDGRPRATVWRRGNALDAAALFFLDPAGPKMLSAGAYWENVPEIEDVLRRWTEPNKTVQEERK